MLPRIPDALLNAPFLVGGPSSIPKPLRCLDLALEPGADSEMTDGGTEYFLGS